MASEAGPNLVTDGLVLSLDAANTQNLRLQHSKITILIYRFLVEEKTLYPFHRLRTLSYNYLYPITQR